MQAELFQQETSDVAIRDTFFNPVSWQNKIDFINHLVLFNNLLIVVLAEKAGGKTSFVHLLQKKLDPRIHACLINVTSSCNSQMMVQTMREKLHLKQPEGAPTEGLKELITEIQTRQIPVLLVVDNAQNLPVSLLKDMLQGMQAQKENPYFHVCLVSDYSVVVTYNQLAKGEFSDCIHTIELGLLNEMELRTYVTQKVSGNKKVEKLLSSDQLQQLYNMTGGCLSKINQYLENLKIEPVQGKKDLSYKHIALACLGVFLISSVSLFIFSHHKEISNIPVYVRNIAKNIASPTVNPDGTSTQAQAGTALSLPSQIANLEEASMHQLLYNGLPKKQLLNLSQEDDSEYKDMPQGVIDQVVVIPKINLEQTVKQVEENSELVAILSKPHIKKLEPSKIQPVKPVKAESKGFTIQLLASHQIADIHRFKRTYKLEGKSLVRRVIREDDSWYILTLGEFESIEKANMAVSKLSSELLHYKPWVRVTDNLKMIG